MAKRAFICRVRTDIPAGALQFTDLEPNTSLKNNALFAYGQTGYLGPVVQNDDPTVAGVIAANATTVTLNGLSAYILDAVARGGTGQGATAAEAKNAAASIIAKKNAGTDLTLADVNASLVVGVGAGTTLTTGGSLGSLTSVLRILAGEVYTTPVGMQVNGGAAYKAAISGAFDATASFEAGAGLELFSTGALQVSCGAGQLAGFASASFEYLGVTGRALSVYDWDGTCLA